MATEKKAAEAAKTEEEIRAEQERYYKEPVKLKLFKDSDRYKDDVFVAVNGKRYQIKRGVEVTVPRNVALAVERSLDQRDAASAFITYYSSTTQEIGQ